MQSVLKTFHLPQVEVAVENEIEFEFEFEEGSPGCDRDIDSLKGHEHCKMITIEKVDDMNEETCYIVNETVMLLRDLEGKRQMGESLLLCEKSSSSSNININNNNDNARDINCSSNISNCTNDNKTSKHYHIDDQFDRIITGGDRRKSRSDYEGNNNNNNNNNNDNNNNNNNNDNNNNYYYYYY